jgi:Zn-finger nucleic acid-binding protein
VESRKKSHQNSTKPPKCRGLWVNYGGNFKEVARRLAGIAKKVFIDFCQFPSPRNYSASDEFTFGFRLRLGSKNGIRS